MFWLKPHFKLLIMMFGTIVIMLIIFNHLLDQVSSGPFFFTKMVPALF